MPPWKPGQTGNPNGRPKRSVEEASLDRFREYFNADRFDSMLDTLVKVANRGNIKALELILAYKIGKPAQTVDLNTAGDLRITVEYKRDSDSAA